jgi:hypothetical protein
MSPATTVCAPGYDYALACNRAAVQDCVSDQETATVYTALLSTIVVALIERLGRPAVAAMLRDVLIDTEILP